MVLNELNTAIPNYELYQPDASKQMILYERASSESVHALFKLRSIECKIIQKINAQFMSQNGKLPVVYIEQQRRVLCGFKEVATHLFEGLDIEAQSYIDFVDSGFLHAEMAICWTDSTNLSEYTYPRYTYELPWPLNRFYYWQRKSEIKSKLGNENFMQMFLDFLVKLNQRIGAHDSDKFALGTDEPTVVDCLIYGHVSSIFNDNMPSPLILNMDSYPNIKRISDDFAKVIDKKRN